MASEQLKALLMKHFMAHVEHGEDCASGGKGPSVVRGDKASKFNRAIAKALACDFTNVHWDDLLVGANTAEATLRTIESLAVSARLASADAKLVTRLEGQIDALKSLAAMARGRDLGAFAQAVRVTVNTFQGQPQEETRLVRLFAILLFQEHTSFATATPAAFECFWRERLLLPWTVEVAKEEASGKDAPPPIDTVTPAIVAAMERAQEPFLQASTALRLSFLEVTRAWAKLRTVARARYDMCARFHQQQCPPRVLEWAEGVMVQLTQACGVHELVPILEATPVDAMTLDQLTHPTQVVDVAVQSIMLLVRTAVLTRFYDLATRPAAAVAAPVKA